VKTSAETDQSAAETAIDGPNGGDTAADTAETTPPSD
jgi:hypothetical protein